jgi:hypothetical protein
MYCTYNEINFDLMQGRINFSHYYYKKILTTNHSQFPLIVK